MLSTKDAAKRRRRNDRLYAERLNGIVDDLFAKTALSDAELAAEAGLAPSTVYCLRTRTTQLPRLSTVVKLGLAVGLEVRIVAAQPQIAGRRRRRAA